MMNSFISPSSTYQWSSPGGQINPFGITLKELWIVIPLGFNGREQQKEKKEQI
jgi:hypothetical protein